MMHMKFSGVEIYYVIDQINSRLPNLDVHSGVANGVPGEASASKNSLD